MDERYSIQLFADMPTAEVQWIRDNGREVHLEAGTFFLCEHDSAEEFYIVLAGELQITRTINGREQVMGTTPRGIIGGEISLLTNTPSQVTARALVPSDLLVLDRRAFRAMFAYAPTIGAQVLQIGVNRMQGYVTTLVQQEKMAALGKMSAGLAHELNNPAAAANRAAASLRETLLLLQSQAIRLNRLSLSADQIEQLITFQQQTISQADQAEPLSPLEQSDREDELGEWFEDQGVAGGWELAPCFVGAAMGKDNLANLRSLLTEESFPLVLAWLHRTLDTTSLLNEIEQSTRRIAELVGAIKSYAYKDQSVVKEVDVHKSLESALLVLGHKLKRGNLHVSREYDPNLPHIQARAGELNQVWTNMIDNAIDALNSNGTIRLITRCEHDFVMVEVADDGPGIPPEVQSRLFEPFFTTKEEGKGTGLGLDISYRIIQEHNGSIEVQSQPGQTRFIIRLPVS
ncbi:MAG: ATP-binding protein [Chloroflexaceae bacterium]